MDTRLESRGDLDQKLTSGHGHPEGRIQSLEMAEAPRQGGAYKMQRPLRPGAFNIKGSEGEEPGEEGGQAGQLGGR